MSRFLLATQVGKPGNAWPSSKFSCQQQINFEVSMICTWVNTIMIGYTQVASCDLHTYSRCFQTRQVTSIISCGTCIYTVEAREGNHIGAKPELIHHLWEMTLFLFTIILFIKVGLSYIHTYFLI